MPMPPLAAGVAAAAVAAVAEVGAVVVVEAAGVPALQPKAAVVHVRTRR